MPPIRGCCVEVALVRLTHRELDAGTDVLSARIEHLEREVARLQCGRSGGGAARRRSTRPRAVHGSGRAPLARSARQEPM